MFEIVLSKAYRIRSMTSVLLQARTVTIISLRRNEYFIENILTRMKWLELEVFFSDYLIKVLWFFFVLLTPDFYTLFIRFDDLFWWRNSLLFDEEIEWKKTHVNYSYGFWLFDFGWSISISNVRNFVAIYRFFRAPYGLAFFVQTFSWCNASVLLVSSFTVSLASIVKSSFGHFTNEAHIPTGNGKCIDVVGIHSIGVLQPDCSSRELFVSRNEWQIALMRCTASCVSETLRLFLKIYSQPSVTWKFPTLKQTRHSFSHRSQISIKLKSLYAFDKMFFFPRCRTNGWQIVISSKHTYFHELRDTNVLNTIWCKKKLLETCRSSAQVSKYHVLKRIKVSFAIQL